MKGIVSNLLILIMSATYFLLAMQAEPITMVLGYVFGGILFAGLMMSTWKAARSREDA